MELIDHHSHPVTVLGLGAMGAAIASTLAGRGHPTTVWNRTAGKAPAEAREVATAAEAAAASQLVLVCVLDHTAVRDVLEAAAGRLAGRTVVNLTSGTPEQARDTAAWVTERGADYLDGGILADPENVGTPQTSFLYSGSQQGFDEHRAALEALGSTQYLGRDPGTAAVFFMALVGTGYETWLAYLDALALGAAEQVEATALGPFVSGMFASMTGLLDDMARAADDGEHPPAAGPLRVHAALMDDVIDARRARGVDTVQLERVKTLVDRRVQRGHGDEGFSSLIEELRPPAVPRMPGLHATAAQPLSFAPGVSVRAFLLERPAGNLLIYNTGALEHDAPLLRERGVTRQYLSHWHEAMFGSDAPARAAGATVLASAADVGEVLDRGWAIDEQLTSRQTLDDDFEVIPIPGHTPGATAFLWRTGNHRLLFTGDTIYLQDGEWKAGLLDSSDREQFIASLELLRDLEFDVLVPWAASGSGPYAAKTTPEDAGRRIDELLDELRSVSRAT